MLKNRVTKINLQKAQDPVTIKSGSKRTVSKTKDIVIEQKAIVFKLNLKDQI
jgi:hypothetical protein